jgi:hypothetical protein
VPPCTLEVGIGERFGLVERAAVAVVARVERPPFHKSLQSQAFTRNLEER